MIRTFFAAAFLCVLFASNADARPRHGHHSAIGIPMAGCSDPIMHHCHVHFLDHKRGRKNYRAARIRMPRPLRRLMAEAAGRAVGIVRSSSGATAHVAPRAAGAFQCLVTALDRQGYPIRFMGGYRRHGSVRGSLHPAGLALDINQLRRNVTRPQMPRDEIALASACGLVSGAQWANGDSGHFQFGGWSGREMRLSR